MDFYNCLVEWSDGDESNLRNFWVWAEDIGEAIRKSYACSNRLEILNPFAINIDLYDFEELPEEVYSTDDGETFIAEEYYTFPTETVYRLPFGVILSFEKCEFDDTQIEPGYDVIEYENGLVEIEIFVEESEILKVYLELITILPNPRVFMVKLQEDWEDDSSEEIFVNEEITTIDRVKDFIEANKINTLQNGHLTLTTYFDEGQTNISISDHKTLVILTYDKKIARKGRDILKTFDLHEKENLVCVSRGFHHWHYKHPDGLDRKDFIKSLEKQSFVKWQLE